jgi:hypothetical protein
MDPAVPVTWISTVLPVICPSTRTELLHSDNGATTLGGSSGMMTTFPKPFRISALSSEEGGRIVTNQQSERFHSNKEA